MDITPDLLRQMAAELQLRPDMDTAVLQETARRLSGMLTRVRAMQVGSTEQSLPAFAFAATHPAYVEQPGAETPRWLPLAEAGVGGTGYGGSVPSSVPGSGQVSATAPQASPSARDLHADLGYRSLRDLSGAIARRELSSLEVTQALLARMQALEPTLNALSDTWPERALEAARAADAALARGEASGPLHGIPVLVKDLVEMVDTRTTAGSRQLADHVSRITATSAARLAAAGALVAGKTNTHEFAFGTATDTPPTGPTRNPWHTAHNPSGSSGGSGAAVAAGYVSLALGTDTGGSIRLPAAACGIVGLKPSYGRVSKYGVFPLSWSLDHVGPLTRTVADAALALAVLAGSDPLDPTAAYVPVADYVTAATDAAAIASLRGVRIGLPATWLAGPMEPEVLPAFHQACEVLRLLGAELVEVELPPAPVMALVNRVITMSEAGTFHGPMLKAHPELYTPEVRMRLELGSHLLASDYLAGQQLRGDLARTVAGVMQQVDALIMPTQPLVAAEIGGTGTMPWGESVADATIRFAAPWSVTGQPGLSVPMGHGRKGLPLGLQIVGRPFDEATVLRIGAAYEAATPWHAQKAL